MQKKVNYQNCIVILFPDNFTLVYFVTVSNKKYDVGNEETMRAIKWHTNDLLDWKLKFTFVWRKFYDRATKYVEIDFGIKGGLTISESSSK